MQVPELLQNIREATGLKQADLARKIGVSQGTVSKWAADQVSPNKRQWDTLLDFVRSDPRTRHLVDAEPETVQLVGVVGAGAQAHFYEGSQGPFDQVPAPEGSTEHTVAVEIRGESLGPLFDKWLVFYDDVRRPATADLIGKLCVVGLDDGRVLIKKLQRSKSPGLYHLVSQTEPPILDVPIEWAAMVKHMVPR